MHWLYAVRLLLNGNLPVTKSRHRGENSLTLKTYCRNIRVLSWSATTGKNLNGLWKYAITPKGTPAPATYQGDILVPFAVESPDGLYTAPTDEALVYDIQKTKYLGFNMIRKHIKVEPARWYTHCDQLGIIVWQDMPSGDRNPEWQNRKYFEGTEKKRSAVSEACYRKEWKEIMDCLYSYPCIGTWVPFERIH